MASGKASRRKRAAQKAQAPAPPGQGRSARLWWMLGGLAAAIAIAVGAGIVLADGGGDAAPVEGATLPEAADAIAAYAGVPQSGIALGSPDAPVTLVEYVDLQCPFCRQFAVETMPTLVERYVRPGKLRIELRGLAFLGPESVRGMRAVFAAGQQDRLFELMELFFYVQGPENSGWLSDDLVEAAARSLDGLDVARLREDMGSGPVSDLLEAHAADARQRGVDSTPTVLVGRTGGSLERVQMSSATDLAAIERAIDAA